MMMLLLLHCSQTPNTDWWSRSRSWQHRHWHTGAGAKISSSSSNCDVMAARLLLDTMYKQISTPRGNWINKASIMALVRGRIHSLSQRLQTCIWWWRRQFCTTLDYSCTQRRHMRDINIGMGQDLDQASVADHDNSTQADTGQNISWSTTLMFLMPAHRYCP